MKSSALLATAAALALGLTACSTVEKVNPFHKGSPNAIVASQGERIPVNPTDDALEPASALKGQSFLLPPPSPMADWPLPGGTPEQAVEHVDAAPAFAIAWKRSVGESSNRQRHVTAPLVAAGGRIFAMDAEATVSAHDPNSGAKIWSADLRGHDRHDRNAFGGGVAYADGRLYVASGYRFMAALDATTGKVLWKVKTETPIHAAPTVANGRVFVVSLEDELLAFDAKTGAQIWNYQALEETARMLGASSPAVSGETVVSAFGSGEVVALQAVNGNVLWSESLSRSSRSNALSEIRDIPGRPIIFRGDVLAASHSGLFADIDLRTGGVKWALPVASISSPWAAGDVVYLVSQAGQLMCVARDSGQIYWMADLNKTAGKAKGGVFGIGGKNNIPTYWFGPILASNRLIVVSSTGEARALNPRTGAQTGSLNLGSPTLMPPIAVGGMLYLITDKADLVAIR